MSFAGKAFSFSSTFIILLTLFVEGLTAVEEDSATSALLVPLLAGGLGVAFSFPFLVAILKKERESKLNSKRYIARKRTEKVVMDAH